MARSLVPVSVLGGAPVRSVVCFLLALCATAAAAQAPPNTAGTLAPIWRHQPVIGIWLTGGQGLAEIPAYLDGTDFPYPRRPYPLEVPFADSLTVVRLLGGWVPRDLGKGETGSYGDIAEADLVTRRFGAPTERTSDLIDLAALTCDEAAGTCAGEILWAAPSGPVVLVADDTVLTCSDQAGAYAVTDLPIGGALDFALHQAASCAAPAPGAMLAQMTVYPSQIDYHFDLLTRRLDPYLAQGYQDLTLVLDNFPWALPVTPTTGAIGQTAPPASPAVWRDFVGQMIDALIAAYGREVVARFRYRLGTEQQSPKRFSGTPQAYLALYEATVTAIRARLPEARIGPFNQAGAEDDPEGLNYVFLYDNLKDPGAISYVAHSLYYIPKARKGSAINTYPAQRLPAFEKLWDQLPMAPGTTIEFQEFGVLRNLYDQSTSEPGARGAALHVADLFAMLAAGVDAMWHWTAFERLIVAGEGVRTQVLYGRGWLYLVLRPVLGGTIYPVSPAPGGPEDPLVSAHYIDTDGTDALVVSTFHLNQARDGTTPFDLTIELPRELLPGPQARFSAVSLSQETAVFDLIRADFAREGVLSADYEGAGQPVATIAQMGGQPGRRYVAQNWPRYEAAIVDTLTRTPVTPQMSGAAETPRLHLSLPAPAVWVVFIDPP